MMRRQLDLICRVLAGRALGLAEVLRGGGAARVNLRLVAGGDPANPATWIVSRRLGRFSRADGADIYPWIDSPIRATQAQIEVELHRQLDIGAPDATTSLVREADPPRVPPPLGLGILMILVMIGAPCLAYLAHGLRHADSPLRSAPSEVQSPTMEHAAIAVPGRVDPELGRVLLGQRAAGIRVIGSGMEADPIRIAPACEDLR
jgi:hypothetical protein